MKKTKNKKQLQKEIDVAVALGQKFVVVVADEHRRIQYTYDIHPVAESMEPLVFAVDDTFEVKVICNCRGKFNIGLDCFEVNNTGACMAFLLRNEADPALVEKFFSSIVGDFNKRNRKDVVMKFWKDFKSDTEYFYYLELIYVNSKFPLKGKAVVDRAILAVAEDITTRTSFFKNWREAGGQAQ